MFGIFEAITGFFETVFAVINLVVTVVVALFQYLFTALSLLTEIISFVPVIISAPLFICLILGIIFKVAGRNSSADS